jgi:hypothetical protein
VLLTYEDRKFADVPQGAYDVELAAVEQAKPFDGPSKYGRASGPRLLWRFRILAGPLVGQELAVFTGSEIVQKSALLGLLTLLLGRQLVKGEQIDPESFRGFRYRATWGINPNSEQGRCHISSLMPLGGNAITRPDSAIMASMQPGTTSIPQNTASVAQNTASMRPTAPPPPSDGALFEVELEAGKPPKVMSRSQLEAVIAALHLDPKTLIVTPQGKAPLRGPASGFGFVDAVPF